MLLARYLAIRVFSLTGYSYIIPHLLNSLVSSFVLLIGNNLEIFIKVHLFTANLLSSCMLKVIGRIGKVTEHWSE